MNYVTRSLLLAAMLCSGCAKPSGGLFPGVVAPAELDKVEITMTVGPEAVVACNGLMWRYDKVGVAFNAVLNAGIYLGCAEVYWDNGAVFRCNVYNTFGWSWVTDHELEHCRGYMD